MLVFRGTTGEGGSIYRLVPVPLEEQASTLARLGEFNEALALSRCVWGGLMRNSGSGDHPHYRPP